MNIPLKESLESIRQSVSILAPDLVVLAGALLIITAGLIWKNRPSLFHVLASGFLLAALLIAVNRWDASAKSSLLFDGMLKEDAFAGFLRLLFLISGILTVVLTWVNKKNQHRLPEYYGLILVIVAGADLMVMSENLLMLFLSVELVSISSYVITAFSFDKKAMEGSMKYFVFGSVASAVMLYGFSLLYGLTGTLSFTDISFVQSLAAQTLPMVLVATVFSIAGLLYKIAAVPMHPWAPDVYESAPMPVVAFFSVVPKLAGLGILAKFLLILNLNGQPDWQLVLATITILTLTVGNFSALWQKNVKRLMAYSSIAQSGFLLVALVAFSTQGYQYFLFYASVYVSLTFLVFLYLQEFEKHGATTIANYAGISRRAIWPSIFLLVGFIGLTGLPPTSGFTAKLFVFSSLWEAYATTGKQALLWVLIFGLLNTVVSLFFYLRIPYYAFVRPAQDELPVNSRPILNLLGAFLVLLVLLLFFKPGLLMGWINKITFAF